jgi:hypothetical protein
LWLRKTRDYDKRQSAIQLRFLLIHSILGANSGLPRREVFYACHPYHPWLRGRSAAANYAHLRPTVKGSRRDGRSGGIRSTGKHPVFVSIDHLFSSSRALDRDNDGAGLRVRDDADLAGKPGRLRKVVSMD